MSEAGYDIAGRLVDLVARVDRGEALRIADIMETYGVNEAAARRYVAFVRERRELVESKEGRVKVWRLRPEPDPSPEGPAKAAALAFAVKALTELEGTPLLRQLDNLAEAARLALPESAQTRLDRLTRNFRVRSVHRSVRTDRAEIVATLVRAIEDRRVCEIRYQKADGNVKSYSVEPWGFILSVGRLLLSGDKVVGGKRELRFFNIDGILELTRLDTRPRFPEPSATRTEWEAHFADAFGVYLNWGAAEEVRLRVRGPHAVRLSQRILHPSQQTSMADDGWMDVHLRVMVCPDLKSWILGMLPDVEVVAPVQLRDELRRLADEWVEAHRSRMDRRAR